MIVNIVTAFESYGSEFQENIYKSDGSSGEISFESLLKVALVLNCLDDFKNIAIVKSEKYETMDDLLKVKPIKKRGTIK